MFRRRRFIQPAVYGAVAGGGGGGSFTTWNPADRANATLDATNLVFTNNGLTTQGTDAGVRAISGKSAGKLYWEATWTYGGGPIGDTSIGTSPNTLTFVQIANGALGIQMYTSGNLWINGVNVRTAATSDFHLGGTIGVAVDFTLGLIWLTNNGTTWSGSSGTPSAGTGGNSITALTPPFFPCVTDTGTSNGVWTANFGATAFAYALPTGFTGWTP